jgi:hypothetical protein
VGFPIRRSLDQSSFAAPQGLSQRTTSFIASQRQGIHQMLLRHLIALMIDVRPAKDRTRSKKDLLSTTRIESIACRTHPAHMAAGHGWFLRQRLKSRMCSLFTMSNIRAALEASTARKLFQTSGQMVEPDGIEPTTS